MADLYRYLDLRSSEERRISANEAAIERPVPGDYWHEMYSPYFIVLEFDGVEVTICETKLQHRDGWSFDLSKTRRLTREDMRLEVTYSSMRDKFVADVVPYTPKSKLKHTLAEWRAMS